MVKRSELRPIGNVRNAQRARSRAHATLLIGGLASAVATAPGGFAGLGVASLTGVAYTAFKASEMRSNRQAMVDLGRKDRLADRQRRWGNAIFAAGLALSVGASLLFAHGVQEASFELLETPIVVAAVYALSVGSYNIRGAFLTAANFGYRLHLGDVRNQVKNEHPGLMKRAHDAVSSFIHTHRHR